MCLMRVLPPASTLATATHYLHKESKVTVAVHGGEPRTFDWETRWRFDAWRVTDAETAHRFAVALAEGGLPPQYVDEHPSTTGGPIFWWDRHLTVEERGVAVRALTLAIGLLPEDAD